MKRWICSILAVLMLLTVLTTTAFASHGHNNSMHRHSSGNCTGKKTGTVTKTCIDRCDFTDENGDGVCDACENKCADCGVSKDENADGICDSCGHCSHYRDEDGDGICDHQAECAKRKQHTKETKTSNHHSRKHRNHH